MENIEKRIIALEEKIDSIYISVEKTRKYFLWILVITVIAFILPIILMIFTVPRFIDTYNSLGGLGL